MNIDPDWPDESEKSKPERDIATSIAYMIGGVIGLVVVTVLILLTIKFGMWLF